jgi:hypothetical protein
MPTAFYIDINNDVLVLALGGAFIATVAALKKSIGSTQFA